MRDAQHDSSASYVFFSQPEGMRRGLLACSPGMLRVLFLLVTAATLRCSQAHRSSASSIQDDSRAEQQSSPLASLPKGVDYYPEQWPAADMAADMRSIRHDLGADTIRVGEFMWALLEPQDGLFNFSFLDSVIAEAGRAGLRVMLGTPTATMPAWLAQDHPDVLGRAPDGPSGLLGATPIFGGRRQYSFHSATYRRYSNRIVRSLAQRYGKNPTVAFWQLDNELGHEGSDLDFSDAAEAAWRAWLRVKFGGDVEALNEAWGTTFWGAIQRSFETVPLPRWTRPGGQASPFQSGSFRSNLSPGMLLDYRRFMSEAIAAFALEQRAIVANYSAAPVTTNSPGGLWSKAMDSNAFFPHLGFVGYDNYPVWGGSLEPTAPAVVAMAAAQMRGMGRFDRAAGAFAPFAVIEQLIGAQGHDIIGYTPRPHQAVAWSAQMLAHGCQSISFFRWRAAAFGQEEFCYGVLDQATPRGTGRKLREARQVFELMRSAEALWTQPISAKVAVLYDFQNVWAWQAQPQSTAFDFGTELARLYTPFWHHGVPLDVVSTDRLVSGEVPIDQYDVLLLPVPMLVHDDLVAQLHRWIEDPSRRRSLWLGYRSDLKVHATNQMRTDTSRLASLAGIAIQEIESLLLTRAATLVPADVGVGLAGSSPPATAKATVWREGLSPLDDSTKPIWKYDDAFFGALNLSAVTRRQLASSGGEVIYIGCGIEAAGLQELATSTLNHVGLLAGATSPSHPPSVELVRRGEQIVWINHGEEPWRMPDGHLLQPYEVRIVGAR